MSLSFVPGTSNGGVTVGITIPAGEETELSLGFDTLDLTSASILMYIGFPVPQEFSTENGKITLVSSTQILVDLPVWTIPGNYPYEFWITGANGKPERFWTGSYTVLKSITPNP